jgi:hypothetical protein
VLDKHIAENMANIIIDIAEQTEEVATEISKFMTRLNDLEKRMELLEKSNNV